MNRNRLTYLTILGLAMSIAATGCKHKPVDVTNLPGRRPGAPSGSPTPLDQGGQLKGSDVTSTTGGIPLPEDLSGNLEERFNLDRAALAAHTVHFEYDSAAVKSSEKPHVQAVADYFKSATGVALLIEGHCDERGTEEYNRALGERRALSLREALIAMGADGMKITTRSYGKDRKVDLGESEAAHARNRRGEFVVLKPK